MARIEIEECDNGFVVRSTGHYPYDPSGGHVCTTTDELAQFLWRLLAGCYVDGGDVAKLVVYADTESGTREMCIADTLLRRRSP